MTKEKKHQIANPSHLTMCREHKTCVVLNHVRENVGRICLSVVSAIMRRGLRKNADLCAGQEMKSLQRV